MAGGGGINKYDERGQPIKLSIGEAVGYNMEQAYK